MPWGARKADRVHFQHTHAVNLMAVDGTWRRACFVKDVSESDATLRVETSIEGLALTEFFLLLSSTGLAYRRCQLDRVNGDEATSRILRQNAKKKPSRETSL